MGIQSWGRENLVPNVNLSPSWGYISVVECLYESPGLSPGTKNQITPSNPEPFIRSYQALAGVPVSLSFSTREGM